jgi:hypothetical protein
VLARNLRGGRITWQHFEEDMKTRLRLLHTGATAIGKGGWSEVSQSDWGRVGPTLREQYAYLHGFAQDIYERRETITEKMIAWRARLYGDKAGYSMVVAQAGDVRDFLPYLPRDGSTKCGNRCLCSWLFTIGDVANGYKPVTATWVLDPEAETCETCIGRDGHTESFFVPEGADVPAFIGAR